VHWKFLPEPDGRRVGKVLNKGFDDPPKLAKNAKDEEEAIGHYRPKSEARNTKKCPKH
jgi:hypothetical protein